MKLVPVLDIGLGTLIRSISGFNGLLILTPICPFVGFQWASHSYTHLPICPSLFVAYKKTKSSAHRAEPMTPPQPHFDSLVYTVSKCCSICTTFETLPFLSPFTLTLQTPTPTPSLVAIAFKVVVELAIAVTALPRNRRPVVQEFNSCPSFPP